MNLFDTDDAPTRLVASGPTGPSAGSGDVEVGSIGEVPERIGRYRPLRELGRGGTGIVYAALDPRLDRRVAIKRIRDDLLADVAERGVGERARLVRESRALAALSHPNVIEVYDVEDGTAGFHIVMELSEGMTLREWLRRPHGLDEILRVLRQAGHGLAAAHAVGLVHRDFKPSNAIVGDDGRVRVLDFGLAREATDPSEAPIALPATRVDRSHHSNGGTFGASSESISAGVVVGTPAYMSPEQIEGRPFGPATDQFSYCVTLYEAVHGDRPFPTRSLRDRLAAIRAGAPRPPRRRDVPRALAAVIRRGLAYDAKDRHPSMDALLRALERAQSGRPRRATAMWALAGGLGVVGIAASGVPEVEGCLAEAGALSEAWGPAERGRVERRLAGVHEDLDAAAEAAALGASLDGYVAAWTEARTLACDAAPDAQAAQLRCLEQGRRAFGSTIELLEGSDESVLMHASSLVGALPEPQPCAHARPSVVDPVTQRAIDDLRARIIHARILDAAFLHVDAYRELDVALPDAAKVGDDATLGRLQNVRGQALRKAGELVSAEKALSEAYFAAQRADEPDIATDAAIAMALTLIDARDRFDVAEQWIAHASSSLERVPGGSSRLESEILNARGMVAMRRGQRDAALEHFEGSVKVLSEAPGSPDLQRLSAAVHNVAIVHQELGQLDEAEQREREALGYAERSLGENHPGLASHYNSLGNVHTLQGKVDEALADYAEAIALWKRAQDDPNLGMAYYNVGRLLHSQSDLAGAIENYGEAIPILERQLGPDHPNLAMPLHNLGEAYLQQRRIDDALPAVQRSLDIFESNEVDPIYVAFARFTLARVYRATGRSNGRIRELVAAARAGFEGPGPIAEEARAGLEEWLADPAKL